jgi:adenylate cyclase
MLLVMVIFGYRALHNLGLDQIAPNEDVFRAVFSINMIVAGIYISFMNLLFGISRLVNANLGEGNLWKLITGKYHKPREESFIFMFLDLKSSTTAAEKLGHLKYSEMIQRCFYDLTIPLQNFGGAVYQYVGDEAVIYWKPDQGLKQANCLQLYFEFDQILNEKKEDYLSEYGWHPEFKAGLHLGPAIVTQVGSVKREIAFHGDTLNIAARIIGLCNEKESKILVSDVLRQNLIGNNPQLDQFSFHEKGIETLRGKEEKMGVYEVVIIP